MKIIERNRDLGEDRGKGTLLRYAKGSPNWFFAYYQNGKEHRVSTGTDDLKAAKRFAKQRLDEVVGDRQGLKQLATPAAQRATVQQLLDAYLNDVRLRELKSVGHIIDHARPVANHFGPLRACDVSAKTVDKYIETLRAAGKANATINRQTQILSAAYKLAVARKVVTEAPSIRKLSEAGNARQGFFERDEFAQVLKHLPEYLRDAVTFAYVTGWRKGEIIALKWDWVDQKAGTITLPDSKNGRSRVLAISGDLIELLSRREVARLIERDGNPVVSEYVFHRQGRSLGDFTKGWHGALRRAGFSYEEKQPDGTTRTRYTRTVHDMRRSAVRNLVRSGVREGIAMSVTGHRTRSVFDRYNISSLEDVRQAMEAVKAGAPSRA